VECFQHVLGYEQNWHIRLPLSINSKLGCDYFKAGLMRNCRDAREKLWLYPRGVISDLLPSCAHLQLILIYTRACLCNLAFRLSSSLLLRIFNALGRLKKLILSWLIGVLDSYCCRLQWLITSQAPITLQSKGLASKFGPRTGGHIFSR
jgi:hypothetical protein